jgi:hypothetical protein
MPQTAWLFMHIPKTAGTSFRQIVLRQYRHLGGLESVYDPEAVKSGPKRKDAPAYIGHFRFGFDQFVEGDGRYVCFMREPVRHAWSHYHFLIEMKKLPSEVNSFADFLKNKYGYNLQLRFISGVEEIHGKESDVLEMAKENIRNSFALAAPMERFDDALLLLRRRLDWRRAPVYHRANERPNKPILSEEDKMLAQDILKWEISLYQFILKQFEEDWKNSRISSSDREIFGFFNACYRTFDPIYIWFKSLFRRDSKNS